MPERVAPDVPGGASLPCCQSLVWLCFQRRAYRWEINWKLAGAPFAFRNVSGYKGVCGYEVLMSHPFVDGYLFTRAVDVKKGVGVIMR